MHFSAKVIFEKSKIFLRSSSVKSVFVERLVMGLHSTNTCLSARCAESLPISRHGQCRYFISKFF